MNPLEPPLLDIPFAGGISPHLDDIRDRMWTWIEDLDLADAPAVREKLRILRVERFAARLYPAAEPETVLLAATWQVAGWLADDLLDEGRLPAETCRAVVDGLTGIFRGARPHRPTALERAWADAWDRTRAGRTAEWLTAWTQDMLGFLHSYAIETDHRTREHVPSVRDYVGHRIAGSAMRCLIRLLENGDDGLDRMWRDCSAVRTIRDATAAHVGIVNDLFSADREEASGYYHNAVLILRRTTGCTRAEAAAGAAALADEYLGRFRAACSALPQELAELGLDAPASAVAVRYARECGAMMRGNFDWHLETRRYVSRAAGPSVAVPCLREPGTGRRTCVGNDPMSP